MFELVASGMNKEKKPQERRWTLRPNEPVTLGRDSKLSTWDVNWEAQLSGFHATLTWQGDKLLVQRRMTPSPTTNPILCGGKQCNEFTVGVGEVFTVGGTTFKVEQSALSDSGLTFTCSPQELRQAPYVGADERINALAALPDLIRLSPRDRK